MIVIEIPWEIKAKGEWKRLFENDEPFVDVEVWNEYKDQVGSPEISMELKPKFIGNYEFNFAKIEIPVGDEIPDGIVYVGIIPKPKYTGMELTTLELYYQNYIITPGITRRFQKLLSPLEQLCSSLKQHLKTSLV